MKNLFNDINVSTNKNDAQGSFTYITLEDWNKVNSCDVIHYELQGIGVSPDEYDMYFEGVDVIENALNSAYEDETVYFWVD